MMLQMCLQVQVQDRSGCTEQESGNTHVGSDGQECRKRAKTRQTEAIKYRFDQLLVGSSRDCRRMGGGGDWAMVV